MSIISHLLYDEQQSATYQQEAESILCLISGFTVCEADAQGCGRIYRMAMTEVLRNLTLFDLYHEPVLARTTLSEERQHLAARAAGDFLRKNGWTHFTYPETA